MSAIEKISLLSPNYRIKLHNKQNHKQAHQLKAVSDNNLLENYLSLMGKANLSLVSFGNNQPMHPVLDYNKQIAIENTGVHPFGKNFMVEAFRPGISSYAKWKIQTEATNRIYGRYAWPQIDNIKAWMVSAETEKFMAVGGLAKVAADLPNSFNKRFKNKDDQMINITPMYTDNKNKKLVEKDGKLFYQYQVKNIKDPITNKIEQKVLEIEVDKIGEVNVPIYNPSTNTKMEDTLVEIYKGYTDYTRSKQSGEQNDDGTYYYFLNTPATRKLPNGEEVENAQIFNVQDKDSNSPNNGTAYANNIYGTDEVFRMAFFSKAVYEMMKDAKEGRLKNIEAPNSVILNDWHAGPLAAMIKYTANAEADTGKISKQAGEYFNEVPTIFIAHNIEHQGSTNGDNNKRASIFATLFGEHGVDILANAKSWEPDDKRYKARPEDSCSLMRWNDFNSAMTGMSLADRVVPVSVYYGEELTKSNLKANGLMDLMRARAFGEGQTLTPITNGYSKDLIAPTINHMNKVWADTKSDFIINGKETVEFKDMELLPYNDGNLANKIHNKNVIMNIFQQTIERERKLMNEGDYNERKYLLHDPFNTDIQDIKDFSNVPVIAYSGRVDPQKGLDTILKDAILMFADKNINTPKDKLPIFIIGGKISQNETYEALAYGLKDELMRRSYEAKDPVAKEGYKNIANRILLIKGFVRTDLVATASDMFLVPSKFEPCGLTQLEAMAKGSLPIATSTGGLVNTIRDGVDGFRTKVFFDMEGWKTGQQIFGVHKHYQFKTNGEAYCDAIERALKTYNNDPAKFEEMQKTAIQNDFSWDKEGGALDQYVNLLKTGRPN